MNYIRKSLYLDKIESSVNGKKYYVRNLPDKNEAADKLSNIGISLDESVDEQVLKNILSVFSIKPVKEPKEETSSIPKNLLRTSKYLQHPVFNSYRTETEMLRYIKRLYEKDIALDRAMIPLGSCTMKLNSTSEMLPVSWPEFSSIHPFAPENQTKGYKQLIDELKSNSNAPILL